jgi:hypothetical protein
VFHQQVDDEVGVDQGRRVDPQVVEGGVPSDKVGRPDAQEAEYRLEGLPVQRVLLVRQGIKEMKDPLVPTAFKALLEV